MCPLLSLLLSIGTVNSRLTAAAILRQPINPRAGLKNVSLPAIGEAQSLDVVPYGLRLCQWRFRLDSRKSVFLEMVVKH